MGWNCIKMEITYKEGKKATKKEKRKRIKNTIKVWREKRN